MWVQRNNKKKLVKQKGKVTEALEGPHLLVLSFHAFRMFGHKTSKTDWLDQVDDECDIAAISRSFELETKEIPQEWTTILTS